MRGRSIFQLLFSHVSRSKKNSVTKAACQLRTKNVNLGLYSCLEKQGPSGSLSKPSYWALYPPYLTLQGRDQIFKLSKALFTQYLEDFGLRPVDRTES